jgi:asparagine synthase (glutamine-hydrolysing)
LIASNQTLFFWIGDSVSGIAGVFHISGEPVSERQLEAMATALAYRGPDGTNLWFEDQIGLAIAHFHTTPEDVAGRCQPVMHPNNTMRIVADARIDNRSDLLAALSGYLPQQEEPFTSAELILAAYERWGEACLEKIVGDFAFAIWNADQKSLFLARDPMGIRQLHYAFLDNTFYFATSIGAVLAALPRPAKLNTNLMKAFLMGSTEMWICQTMYEEIHRLPPAHSLVVQEQKPVPTLYDCFEPKQRYDYKNEKAWTEAFLALLEEVIRCRMHGSSPISLSVSGGLDSSSVAAIAYRLAQKGESFPQVRLYSTIFEETPDADEKDFLDVIASHCDGWPTTRIVSDDLWAFKEFGGENGYPFEEPDLFPLRSHTLALLRAGSADGSRVLLTGDMAEIVMGILTYMTPAILRGIPLKYWRQEISYFQYYSKMYWSELLLRAFIRPLVPDSLLKGFYRFWSPEKKEEKRPWLTDYARSYKKERCPTDPRFYSPPALDLISQVVYYHIRRGYDIVRLSALDALGGYTQVEWRHPFLDRRLVDFLLHIPQNLRTWQGIDRVILRKSLRQILPEPIRRRGKSNNFGQLTERGFFKEKTRLTALTRNSQLEKLGLVSSQILSKSLIDFWAGKPVLYRYLFNTLSLEAWLREN